ncbi:MAG: hypothetical protein AAF458_21320 [Pseudomonadota bacterium]
MVPITAFAGSLHAWLTRLAGRVGAAYSVSHSGWAACTVGILLIGVLAPTSWHSNEINNFDLAWRIVTDEPLAANSAVFDTGRARIVTYAVLGRIVDAVGFDWALVIARALALVASMAALVRLAQAWTLSPAATGLALVVFLASGQSFVASAWIYGSAEPKTFAYAFAMLAIAAVTRRSPGWATIWLILATALHFLVGGFWTLAVWLLMFLHGTSGQRVLRYAGIYVVMIAPLAGLIIVEQLNVPELTPLDLTINQIYAEFRVPHHVAPFVAPVSYFPGAAALTATGVALVLLRSDFDAQQDYLRRWLVAGYAYLLAAFVVAWFDRHTHVLAPFYLFRPNALLLLLTLLLAARQIERLLRDRAPACFGVIALTAVLGYAAPKLVLTSYTTLTQAVPMLPMPPSPQILALIDWIKQETDEADVIVVEPNHETRWNEGWMAFERHIGRPTLAHFKFAPTAPADIHRWYRIVRWRESLFAGDCARLGEFPAQYLVTVSEATRTRLASCGALVFARGDLGVIAVKPIAPARG